MDVLVWLDVLRCGLWIVVIRCVIRSRIVEGRKEGASDEHASVRATVEPSAPEGTAVNPAVRGSAASKVTARPTSMAATVAVGNAG